VDAVKEFCLLAGGRTLQILNAQEDSAGRYTCVATNEAGEALKHYEVKVYSTQILPNLFFFILPFLSPAQRYLSW